MFYGNWIVTQHWVDSVKDSSCPPLGDLMASIQNVDKLVQLFPFAN